MQQGNEQTALNVGIIGGGVAGATAALKLAELGIQCRLFEANESLISGPPICHLHAGGNLYREISQEQCISLLEQSVATMRAFPQAINFRPTLIAIPLDDPDTPNNLLPRLNALRTHYQMLIDEDPNNQMLGEAAEYFSLVDKTQLTRLKTAPLPSSPTSIDEWLVPVAKHLDLDKFQYPMILVNEFGLSVFRLAAIAQLGLESSPHCELLLSQKVTALSRCNEPETGKEKWRITSTNKLGVESTYFCDYLINAAGFQTGHIDDLAEYPQSRLVEYKAAYVAHWVDQDGVWPEIIVHGERGTPQGMAQFTPYAKGFVQLHGMTKNITLFDDGLIENEESSSQPELPIALTNKIFNGWEWNDVIDRTQKAIEHMGQWMPSFSSAEVGGRPLCGAQQIPGRDATLRAADASFAGEHYARIELVKASSGLTAIHNILSELDRKGMIVLQTGWQRPEMQYLVNIKEGDINQLAEKIAVNRSFPAALALPYP